MTRGTILHLTRAEVAHRAWDELTTRLIAYRLDYPNGGNNPEADHCAGLSKGGKYGAGVLTADCIGFVLYCSGIDRVQPDYKGTRGQYLNCASLLDDADGAQRFCRPLRLGEVPRVGDWLLNRKHIGLIIRVDPNGNHLVMDCSPRHRLNPKDVTSPAIGVGYAWSRDCRVIRPTFYKEAA